MWSRAALTLDNLENRSVPGKGIGLIRLFAARIDCGETLVVLLHPGIEQLTFTMWSRNWEEKYRVTAFLAFRMMNSDGSWPVETL